MPQRPLSLFLGLALTIIICWLLQVLKFFFLPLVFAIFIAFLLNPLVEWLRRIKVPNIIASLAALLALIAFVYLIGTIVLQSLVAFQDDFPRYEARVQEMISKSKELANLNLGIVEQERLQAELSRFSLSSLVASTLNSFFSLLWQALFTFVFAIYLIMGRHKLPEKIRRAFSDGRACLINEGLDNIGQQVQRYIWAKTLTSFITGGLVVIVLLSFGVDFPITWGFFTFLLNFIPTIGVAIASLLPTLVAFIQYDWIHALWVLIVLTGVLMTLGNIIEPKILGDSVNLSPLVALFALIFWGWLWGAAGMIIAVPLTAMLKFTFDHIESMRPLGVMMGGDK